MAKPRGRINYGDAFLEARALCQDLKFPDRIPIFLYMMGDRVELNQMHHDWVIDYILEDLGLSSRDRKRIQEDVKDIRLLHHLVPNYYGINDVHRRRRSLYEFEAEDAMDSTRRSLDIMAHNGMVSREVAESLSPATLRDIPGVLSKTLSILHETQRRLSDRRAFPKRLAPVLEQAARRPWEVEIARFKRSGFGASLG